MRTLIFFIIFGLIIEANAVVTKETVAADVKAVGFNQGNFLTFDFVSWMDNGLLSKKQEGNNYEIRGLVYGTTLGYRKLLRVNDFNFSVDAGLILGQSNHQNKSQSITYKQNGASVVGGIFSLGIFTIPISSKVSIGVSAPIVFRSISYILPNDQYEFKTKQKTISYLALDLSWMISNNFAVTQQFGSSFGNDGNIWKIGLGWLL